MAGERSLSDPLMELTVGVMKVKEGTDPSYLYSTSPESVMGMTAVLHGGSGNGKEAEEESNGELNGLAKANECAKG